MKYYLILALSLFTFISCKDATEKKEELVLTTDLTDKTTTNGLFKINPISHATMVLEWDNSTIYVDPVGGKDAFKDQPVPDLILVTDIHGDHLNVDTLTAIASEMSLIVAPRAVYDKLPAALQQKTKVLDNGKSYENMNFTVEAIPMYNLRPEALKFHEKGRGNGYVISKNDKRVYISGDTEDIPEMRALQNIDVAFVCMNLPYTMTIESAADAVIEFAPKKMFPYHYRGTEGLSNVAKFNTLVKETNPNVEVVQLDWYPVN